MHPLINSSLHASINSFIHKFIHQFIHSSMHPPTHAISHQPTHPSTHAWSSAKSFIWWLITASSKRNRNKGMWIIPAKKRRYSQTLARGSTITCNHQHRSTPTITEQYPGILTITEEHSRKHTRTSTDSHRSLPPPSPPLLASRTEHGTSRRSKARARRRRHTKGRRNLMKDELNK